VTPDSLTIFALAPHDVSSFMASRLPNAVATSAWRWRPRWLQWWSCIPL